ncbi:nucleotide exchange factor GrpE [Halorubrum sp. BV1]|uniref:nucleotide exchange factor GrpE n=1 Tax=Halorubrum sp. BV1 TaxID=1498500 RepID=UPI0006786115|nr:nucleotide exchange factor GrpE [Halorubrum sp. BV1]
MSDDDAVDVEVESSDGPETDASAATTDESRDAARANGTAAATAGDPSEDAADVEGESLVDAVAEHDADLAAEVAALEDELAEARAELLERDEEIDELTSKLARVRADFSNYKQRAKQKQEDIRERASESLVERITPVRNDLLRALDQEEGSDLRPGVESTLEKFDEVLADEGVEPIEPDPGSDVDPARHQVMLRVESDQPDGTVHEVYEPGYEMGDRVVSEAKVTVSADEE